MLVRRHGDHDGGIVEDSLFKLVLFLVRPLSQAQMLVVKDFRPGIPEIGQPWNSGSLGQAKTDKMHGMRRTGCHDCVHRMLLKVSLEESHGRSNPEDPWIRNEEIASDEEGQILFP